MGRVQKATRKSSRLFMNSIYKKDPEKIKKHLQNGVNVNYADHEGNTPLHRAVASHDIEITRLMIEHGADVNAKNYHGIRPYHIALDNNFYEALEVLLTKGAIVTELDYFVNRLPQYIAELLYDKVDFETYNFQGHTALQVVIMIDNVPAARRFLARGAKTTVEDSYGGDKPLQLVISCEMAELLLEHGALVNAHDLFGMSPLSSIAISRRPILARDRDEQMKIIELLIDRGAEMLYALERCAIYLDMSLYTEPPAGVIEVLKFMGLKEDEQCYAQKINRKEFSQIYHHVLDEVAKMKETPFYCNRSYYGFLVRSLQKRMNYVDDVRVVNINGVVDDEIESKFPLYSAILKRHVNEARKRKELRDNAMKAIAVACPCLQTFNIVISNIVKYLSSEDMNIVVAACKTK